MLKCSLLGNALVPGGSTLTWDEGFWSVVSKWSATSKGITVRTPPPHPSFVHHQTTRHFLLESRLEIIPKRKEQVESQVPVGGQADLVGLVLIALFS